MLLRKDLSYNIELKQAKNSDLILISTKMGKKKFEVASVII